jgi:hypothetical protein
MKILLTFTAIVEGLTGLSLVAAPSTVVWVLTGTSLEGVEVMTLARITGAALFSLATACFLSRNNAGARGAMKAVLFYNVATAVVLLYAAIVYKLSGIGLWPAAMLHTGLVVWCFVSLRQQNG